MNSGCFDVLLHGNDRAELQGAGEVWEALFHEGDRAFRNSVERVVLADANAGSCMDFGTTLADDDIAWANLGSVSALHSEAFRLGVAAVTCRSLGKFMCHMLEELDRPRRTGCRFMGGRLAEFPWGVKHWCGEKSAVYWARYDGFASRSSG
jgi:hypothetical protein